MCLSESKIRIAIYGASATGKTVVTTELIKLFMTDVKVRHCGELIKKKCNDIGLLSPSDLDVDEHKSIDGETRKLANPFINIIIEGRYLNFVLDGIENILFINLTCSIDKRIDRIAKNSSNLSYYRKLIENSDNEDKQLIRKLYGKKQPKLNHLKTINTTGLSISQCAEEIFKLAKEIKS